MLTCILLFYRNLHELALNQKRRGLRQSITEAEQYEQDREYAVAETYYESILQALEECEQEGFEDAMRKRMDRNERAKRGVWRVQAVQLFRRYSLN